MKKYFFLKPLTLTEEERELVQAICNLQLQAITEGIIDHPNAVDILVYENLNDLPSDSIIPLTWVAIYAFDWVKDNPEQFFKLDEDYMCIFKHILYNCFEEPEYQPTVKSLSRKLRVIDTERDETINLLFKN